MLNNNELVLRYNMTFLNLSWSLREHGRSTLFWESSCYGALYLSKVYVMCERIYNIHISAIIPGDIFVILINCFT